jgi:hypothetical protein
VKSRGGFSCWNDTAVYDFENEGVLRDDFRLALSDDPLIQKFFAVAAEPSAVLNAISGENATVNDVDQQTLTGISLIEERLAQRQLAFAIKYTHQNAPCFCGSGTKFKRCHSQPMTKRSSDFPHIPSAVTRLIDTGGSWLRFFSQTPIFAYRSAK